MQTEYSLPASLHVIARELPFRAVRKWLLSLCTLAGLLGIPAVGFAAELPDGKPRDVWSFEEPEFLPVDEAFRLSAEVAPDGAVLARWEITDGYYLYRHRFGFGERPTGL